jgi:hypothetical protein
MLGVVSQGFAQAFDCRVDAVFEVHHDAARPEPFLDFFAGDHLTTMLKKDCQNLEWLVLQTYSGARLPQFSRSKVNLEDIE